LDASPGNTGSRRGSRDRPRAARGSAAACDRPGSSLPVSQRYGRRNSGSRSSRARGRRPAPPTRTPPEAAGAPVRGSR
jgi:hypothetical protein